MDDDGERVCLYCGDRPSSKQRQISEDEYITPKGALQKKPGRKQTGESRKCLDCGKDIFVRAYRIKQGRGNYCKKCANKKYLPPKRFGGGIYISRNAEGAVPVEAILKYLVLKVKKLEDIVSQYCERKKGKGSKRAANINKSVNTVLTDEQMAIECIKCDSLKMANGMLRCKLQECKYKYVVMEDKVFYEECLKGG